MTHRYRAAVQLENCLRPGDAVLIVQLRALGDMLLASPLIRGFKRRYPDVFLDVLAEPLPAVVIRNNAYLRNILVAPPRVLSPLRFLRLIHQLRKARYRMTVDLLSTPGSALLSAFSGAPARVGFRLPGRSWAYTHAYERRGGGAYNPRTKFDLVRALGVEPDDCKLEIYTGEEDEAGAERIWRSLNIDRGAVVVGLAPWSKRPWRRWDAGRWLALLRQISADRKMVWLLFAGAGERDELAAFERAGDLDVRWAGAGDVMQAAALFRRCRMLLGADNGLKHVAVAAGTPTLTIYTGSDPAVWNPPASPIHKAIDLRREFNVEPDLRHIAQTFEELMEVRSGTSGSDYKGGTSG